MLNTTEDLKLHTGGAVDWRMYGFGLEGKIIRGRNRDEWTREETIYINTNVNNMAYEEIKRGLILKVDWTGFSDSSCHEEAGI